MLDKLHSLDTRYDELMALVSDASVQADQNQYRTHAKALSDIQPVVEKFREYRGVVTEIEQAQELADGSDADMRELAEQELASLTETRDALLAELKTLLIPKDPNDQKNVMLEIRAGTGGDEAGLFAGDLFRMYTRFAERQGWKVEVMSTSETGVGSIKEVIALIEGHQAYSQLKYESGVHRVQRVPATEASGRIHTSTATVAGTPRSGRSGRLDRRQGPADRHVLLERSRRAERQHHILGGTHHARANRPGRLATRREVANQEQSQGHEGAALQAL